LGQQEPKGDYVLLFTVMIIKVYCNE